MRRSTACLNIRWEDKEVFDAIQVWLACQKGRPVAHWDVFSFVLATALGNGASDLSRAELRIGGSLG